MSMLGSVPVLAERGDDALLDGSPAGAADRDPHLVVAAQAEELVLHQKICCLTNPIVQFILSLSKATSP